MPARPLAKYRLLLAICACGAALALLWALWGRGAAHEISPPNLEAAALREQQAAAQSTQRPALLPAAAAAGEALHELPAAVARSEVEGEQRGSLQVEIEVRELESQAPIAGAELLYIDDGDDLENELDLVMELNGLDLEVLRRMAQRTQCDQLGRARLRCRPGKLSLLALSPTHWGLQSHELLEQPSEILQIDCRPQRMLRVRVVDLQGRPVGGVPVRITPQDGGPLKAQVLGATTRARTGLCELGPLDRDEQGLFVAAIHGLFPPQARMEFRIEERLPDPIELVLPDHGSLEVRVLGRQGRIYPGAGGIVAVARSAAGEELCKLSARVLPGSGRAYFPRVGLGLQFEIEHELQGVFARRNIAGPGPTRVGECATIEAALEVDFPCISGRVVDPDGRPLRYRALEFVGAWKDLGSSAEFSAETVTDAGGRFSICVSPGDLEQAGGQLLIYCELGHDVLGALVPLALLARRAELETLTLSPPGLLASGYVIDADGKGVDGTNVEVWKPNPPSVERLAWAQPALSGAQGEFELRGWCASPELEVRAHFRRGSSEGRLRLLVGSSGAIVPFREPKRP